MFNVVFTLFTVFLKNIYTVFDFELNFEQTVNFNFKMKFSKKFISLKKLEGLSSECKALHFSEIPP